MSTNVGHLLPSSLSSNKRKGPKQHGKHGKIGSPLVIKVDTRGGEVTNGSKRRLDGEVGDVEMMTKRSKIGEARLQDGNFDE